MQTVDIVKSKVDHLPAIADCQALCFPNSFAVLLGKQTLVKSLQWFLVSSNRFLIHLEVDGRVVGFIGGFNPGFIGDGAKSGMFRYAIKAAMFAFLKKPLLLLHPEVKKYAPAFAKNTMLRITKTVSSNPKQVQSLDYLQYLQITIIGIHPAFRNKGLAQQLLTEAEEWALRCNKNKLQLSVKQQNLPAIKAYEKAGWRITKSLEDTYQLEKVIVAIEV